MQSNGQKTFAVHIAVCHLASSVSQYIYSEHLFVSVSSPSRFFSFSLPEFPHFLLSTPFFSFSSPWSDLAQPVALLNVIELDSVALVLEIVYKASSFARVAAVLFARVGALHHERVLVTAIAAVADALGGGEEGGGRQSQAQMERLSLKKRVNKTKRQERRGKMK